MPIFIDELSTQVAMRQPQAPDDERTLRRQVEAAARAAAERAAMAAQRAMVAEVRFSCRRLEEARP